MIEQFWQYLIIFLIILLFAKELAMVYAKKRGWISNGDYKREWSEEKFKEIDDKLELFETNHLHTLDEKLETIIGQNKEILFYLKDNKETLKEILKEVNYNHHG